MIQIFTKNLIHFIDHYFGWRNWAVLVYNSVIENMFVIFYIALRRQNFSNQFLADFFLFLIFSSFCTTYGYLINDLGDRKLDRLHRKPNTFSQDSTTKAVLIVMLFLLLSTIFSLSFIRNRWFWSLWLAWIGIATAYSVQPLRLKEKGAVGLILVVVAQRVLPILLVFSAFKHFDIWEISIFTIYIFFRGISSDLNHQLSDFKNDSQTGTNTYAVKSGISSVKKRLTLSLEIEKGCLFGVLLTMYSNLSTFNAFYGRFIFALFVFYLIVYLVQFRLQKITTNSISNPFDPEQKNIFQFIHHGFPSVVLPFLLLAGLLPHNLNFILIFILFIWMRQLYSPKMIRNSYPVKMVANFIRSR